MIYYLVYKLTNTVNGKIYVGCHMTKNLDDGYMGSGRRLRNAQKKYGLESFKKEILKVCETADEMLAEEKKIVDEEFLKRSDVYNLTCGGRGSWFLVNGDPEKIRARNIKCAQRFREKIENDQNFKLKFSKIISDQHRVGKGFQINTIRPDWVGKKHKEETKARISNTRKNQLVGTRNGSFGTCWVSNVELQISKRVPKEHLEPLLAAGWIRGRISV